MEEKSAEKKLHESIIDGVLNNWSYLLLDLFFFPLIPKPYVIKSAEGNSEFEYKEDEVLLKEL